MALVRAITFPRIKGYTCAVSFEILFLEGGLTLNRRHTMII